MSFTIEPARLDQADALRGIERAAQELFRGHPAWPSYAASPMDAQALAEAIGAGRVWVAQDEAGSAVGFVGVAIEDGEVGIAEIDVLPSHGRRGIGAALLEHACAWAAESGYPSVVLGTLSDVPWNAPFYARHGFEAIDPQHYTPALAEHRAHDQERGFPMHLRVFMRRRLRASPEGWTRWPAPAKLNLFLRITGRRADGYHELQTVFRLLDWGDELRLRLRTDGAIRRLTDVPGVPEHDDLVVRAAHLLREHAGSTPGVDIEVEKRIPMGGGLGGGSSDAATVLVALNHLWCCGLDEGALAELGRQLGADVPVFVRGRSAWAEGVGERLTPLDLPRRHYVVLDPHEHVPTVALFQAPELTRNAPRATISSFVSGETTENAFTPVVRERHPRVAAALDWLGRHGAARLSGSGGCVFLESRTREQAQAIADRCPATFTAHVATGVAVSPLHEALGRHGGGSGRPETAG
ncbi:4-(cytidine 5'-diphospho)-2-C-methyl-D-erythritol kinase [Rhodanobacter sp. DHG33]|uniref:4-(cytidine 5'-diphospho)-2-C-methyl-D-erythritol kinase n=1 Tax=Rhodanobacter sp. DHG33 TaxID=2775921 RepID=UPI001786A22D|nr:4-(cytidine 5'-diphospho)-2-C-methyl-D-erythritol kinase [Rhodanobacter sp. DHG33]MBD8900556.1 4-(cytidine 5'-diphospho)-2-C-methyl-D-erythritol kinase [Rhodanobacter sp. DHG33]